VVVLERELGKGMGKVKEKERYGSWGTVDLKEQSLTAGLDPNEKYKFSRQFPVIRATTSPSGTSRIFVYTSFSGSYLNTTPSTRF
jgi:hypothetical protein